jgi:hypothetical protein
MEEEGGLSSLLAEINLLDSIITRPFAEEVITYTQPSTSGQTVQTDYNLQLKLLEFEKRVQDEEKAISELRREYDKVLTDIVQVAHGLTHRKAHPVPHIGMHVAAQVHSAFDDQIKAFEGEISTLGGDGLAQLGAAKRKAVRKKQAVLDALSRLEED